MIRRFALMAALLGCVALGPVDAQAIHGTSCPTGGGTVLSSGDVKHNSVTGGQVHRYRFSVPTGKVARVYLYSAPDADLYVCTQGSSTGTHACQSGSIAFTLDGCILDEMQGNPGFDKELAGGKSYTAFVKNCFDGSTGCVYQGLGNPAVPVQYVIGLTITDV